MIGTAVLPDGADASAWVSDMNDSSFDRRLIEGCVALAQSAVLSAPPGPARTLIDLVSELSGFPSVAFASISRDGRLRLVSVTDERARALVAPQLLSGVGPVPECRDRGRGWSLGELDVSARRWPTFRRAAAELGVQSLIVSAVWAGNEVVGVLSLYSDRPGFPADTARRAASVLARVAAVGLLMNGERALSRRDATDRADASRRQVRFDQASGMLAVFASVSVEDAARSIHRWASRHDLCVADVVTGVLEHPIPALLSVMVEPRDRERAGAGAASAR